MCPVDSSVVYDVVIIGAGISGLAAARILSRESFNILVLEARNRPGGRIHTVSMPATPLPTAESSKCNHDNLSVFHTGSRPPIVSSTPEGPEGLTSSSPEQKSPFLSPQSTSCSSSQSSSNSSCLSDSIDIDLGANYLIGCSNRQSDQPLFHIARLLKVPTAASIGDLCKKYRGWECAELSVWYNHLLPDAPRIPVEGIVADAVFLFDKVTHLATQYYLWNKVKISKVQPSSSQSSLSSSSSHSDSTSSTAPATADDTESYDSVKMFFDKALKDILRSEAQHGLRPSAAFRDATEEGVFQSVLTRYFAYVNPLERLPFSVLEELCETANSPADDALAATKSKSHTSSRKNGRLKSLVDQLATTYPTANQREAYNFWAKRKLTALANGAAGCRPDVAKLVNVRWEDRLVSGRFSDLLAPLLENVPVVYRAVVRSIDWSGCNAQAPVCIQARVTRADSRQCVGGDGDSSLCADEQQEEDVIYKAKHCIISVPVGVLKGLDERSRIQFTPDLPVAKREAIDRLGLPHSGAATHDKVLLRFQVPEHVFWDAEAAHLQCPDSRLHILNLHRYGKPGVLCAHLWGGSGLCPTGRTDAEVVQVILDLLGAMYPRCSLPQPLSYLVTRWSEDPFALGAYTTGEPESQDIDRVTYAATLTSLDAFRLIGDNLQGHTDDQVVKSEDELKSPATLKTKPLSIPRLLFAGEGTLMTSEAKECTHGALQTGVARAIELLPYLVMGSIARQPDGSSASPLEGSQNGGTRLFPDIPLHKLAHYLMGRVDSRKLATNPNFNPMDTDDSNGVVDGFVVKRPKRCSALTPRYSAVWSMTSTNSSSNVGHDDTEFTPSHRKRVRTSSTATGSLTQGRKRGRPPKDGGLANRQAVSDNSNDVSGGTLFSRLASTLGSNDCSRRRAPVNGKSAVVQVYTDQDDYATELPSGVCKSIHSINAIKLPLLKPVDVNGTAALLNFQVIRDSWPTWTPTDKQAVLGQLNLLLSELQSRQQLAPASGDCAGANCSPPLAISGASAEEQQQQANSTTIDLTIHAHFPTVPAVLQSPTATTQE